MTKGIAFKEFKERYEDLTMSNGFGRIANDDELYKIFVGVVVFRQFDRECKLERENVHEREGDYARGN